MELWTKNHQMKSSPFSLFLSKRFDKVPHLELLKKLSQIGVGGCILELISDCVDQRNQFVHLDNTSSHFMYVTSGVPQVSVLEPVMYCVFINDLPAALQFSDPHMFADGSKFFFNKE